MPDLDAADLYCLVLSKDEARVLEQFLRRLTSETGWLNSKWLDDATVHEVATIHVILSHFSDGEWHRDG